MHSESDRFRPQKKSTRRSFLLVRLSLSPLGERAGLREWFVRSLLPLPRARIGNMNLGPSQLSARLAERVSLSPREEGSGEGERDVRIGQGAPFSPTVHGKASCRFGRTDGGTDHPNSNWMSCREFGRILCILAFRVFGLSLLRRNSDPIRPQNFYFFCALCDLMAPLRLSV